MDSIQPIYIAPVHPPATIGPSGNDRAYLLTFRREYDAAMSALQADYLKLREWADKALVALKEESSTARSLSTRTIADLQAEYAKLASLYGENFQVHVDYQKDITWLRTEFTNLEAKYRNDLSAFRAEIAKSEERLTSLEARWLTWLGRVWTWLSA